MTETIDNVIIAHANCKLPMTEPLSRIGARAATPFPPTPGDARIFGLDFWEGTGNWDAAVTKRFSNPSVAFVIIRSGQGLMDSYDDTKFLANARKAIEEKIPWIDYHVLMPQQDAVNQVDHLYGIINALGGELPSMFIWDVELVNSQTPKTISSKTRVVVDYTRQRFSTLSGWYSGPWFTNTYMEKQDWMLDSNYPYWHAQYLWPDQQKERTGINLMLPYDNWLPITQVMIHQTTSYGDASLFGFTGSTHGRIDYNRWMWSEERYKEIFKLVEPEPEPPTGLEERVVKLEERVSDLERWAKGIAYG
jgi:hypothetical protein